MTIREEPAQLVLPPCGRWWIRVPPGIRSEEHPDIPRRLVRAHRESECSANQQARIPVVRRSRVSDKPGCTWDMPLLCAELC